VPLHPTTAPEQNIREVSVPTKYGPQAAGKPF
jgi:hypothetical protein